VRVNEASRIRRKVSRVKSAGVIVGVDTLYLVLSLIPDTVEN